MPKIRVLIVDDAVVVRRLVADALAGDPMIEVVGVAANGKLALQKIPQLNPDVVTMDVEMPEMDGIQTVRELRKTYKKLPVIMFSTLTEHGARATLDALACGASDYVTKPANVGSVAAGIVQVREQLIPKIKSLAGVVSVAMPPAGPVAVKRPGDLAAAAAVVTPVPRKRPVTGVVDLVAIGVSTGGPNALAEMMPLIPRNFGVPIVIVQHMPPVFTRMMAERLSAKSQIKVVEGQDGERVRAGCAYVAPGDHHMTVRKVGDGMVLQLNQNPPENSCRPAVDVLFRSVVDVVGGRCLGVILTGMGSDGLRGCQLMHEAGGRVFAQDEASSVVWGMPGSVARAGLAEKLLPLSRVAAEISSAVGATSTGQRMVG
jgi:two-component system chemotaxis response regulator CheB